MKPKIIVAILVALAVSLIALQMQGRDERAIRRQFKELVRLCEKRPGQGMLRSIAGAGDIRGYFTSNAVIQLGRPYPLRPTPRELAALVARVHVEIESLSIAVHGVEFLPLTESDAREFRTAVELKAVRQGRSESHLDEYRLRWEREDGEWRIAAARADSTIQAADW
ncbi:MAG TPA: hypothetical protein PKE12_09570 [Kiritimatiellia bacterium]|nr:hypothetical protein [Kiritimatiellia bacterium]